MDAVDADVRSYVLDIDITYHGAWSWDDAKAGVGDSLWT